MASPAGSQLIWLDVTVRDVLSRYEVGETVGVGGFAVVKKGRDKRTGQVVAIKVVDKWRYTSEENSEREIRILSRVSHVNCIKMHAVYVTTRRVYIVTELVTGGELLDKVTEKGVFSEPEAAYLTKQVLEGVAYLHSKGIVHRDLKLENILLADNTAKTTIKIADFGLSKVFSASTTLSTVCGSPLYMAPELLTVEQQGDYSPAVDVWSVGVVLFILLAGYSPFDDTNDALLFEKIKSGRYDDGDPVWEKISAGAKRLISRMLDIDVKQRPSAADCLEDAWLSEQARIMEATPEAEVPTLSTGRSQNARQLQSVSRLLSNRSLQRNEIAAGGDGNGGGGRVSMELPDAAVGDSSTTRSNGTAEPAPARGSRLLPVPEEGAGRAGAQGSSAAPAASAPAATAQSTQHDAANGDGHDDDDDDDDDDDSGGIDQASYL